MYKDTPCKQLLKQLKEKKTKQNKKPNHYKEIIKTATEPIME
jgi:hypothetical protein